MTTKYNIGDTIYYLHDFDFTTIREILVEEILIVEGKIEYRNKNNDKTREENSFGTKKEATEKAISLLKEEFEHKIEKLKEVK